LGGVDLDHLIIEKLFVPKIEEVLNEESLFKKLMSKQDNHYAKLYFELLYKAEEIKKELSIKETVISESELNDGDHYIDFEISRNDFNEVIAEKVEETGIFIKKLLEENQKTTKDIERIILVGGTTYIPYIRKYLKETFGILVDNSIDPTTAVMVGAAYFAGTKEETVEESEEQKAVFQKDQDQNKIDIKLIYEVNTQDDEELLVGIAENFEGYFRITRKDGGFDTGLMNFRNKFSEFIKVLPKQANNFTLTVFDENQDQVFETNNISINQGIYNISGQPLPNDICLEVDDAFGGTFLEKIFKKNDILPLNKTIYKTTSKNFNKESDDKLIINILEGKSGTLPASNMSIGYIEINSRDMPINLLKGMDIELKFNMSESRDLSVSVYISSIDFEKMEVFNPHTKHINKGKFQEDIDKVINEIENELSFDDTIDDANEKDFGVLLKFKNIKDELFRIKFDLIEVEEDESTERIFQLDERKRRTLQEYDKLVRFRDVIYAIEEYKENKRDLEEMLEEATQRQKDQFHKIIRDEKIFLESNEKAIIKRKSQELQRLNSEIYFRRDDSYVNLYYHYKFRNPDEYKDPDKIQKLIETGDEAVENKNYQELKFVVSGMYDQLKVKHKSLSDDQDGNLGLK